MFRCPHSAPSFSFIIMIGVFNGKARQTRKHSKTWLISSLLLTIKNCNIGASNSGYYYVIFDAILAIFQLSTPQSKVFFLNNIAYHISSWRRASESGARLPNSYLGNKVYTDVHKLHAISWFSSNRRFFAKKLFKKTSSLCGFEMCEKSPTQGFVLSRIKRAYVSIFDLFSYRLLNKIVIKHLVS